jgi:hypothetical protein
METQKTYPQGYWLNVGICVGIGIGLPLGFIMGIVIDSIVMGIAMGPAIGVGIGAGIGAVLESKYKDRIRPLTEKEKRTRKIALIFGFAIFFILVLLFAYSLLFR